MRYRAGTIIREHAKLGISLAQEGCQAPWIHHSALSQVVEVHRSFMNLSCSGLELLGDPTLQDPFPISLIVL